MSDARDMHGEWFVDSYLELLYGIHGESMWEEADYAEEIIWRLHQMELEGYIPKEFRMTEEEQAKYCLRIWGIIE